MFNLSKKTKNIFIIVSIIFTLGILIAVLMHSDHDPQTETVKQDILQVQAMSITPELSGQLHIYAGEVCGRYESQLAFQVSGKIISRHVEVGSYVKKGQPLMQIDPKDIEQIVKSQLAMVEAAKSQLQFSEKNNNRYRLLFEQEVISRSQMDRFQTAYDVASAEYRNVSAMYAQSLNQLNYCSLNANYDGVVSSIQGEIGQVVGAGQPVMTIVRDGDREIEIYIPENHLQNIHNNQRTRITFWAITGIDCSATIREIAPMADPVTRTYKVRVSLTEQLPEVKLGMTASVEMLGDQDNRIFIPLSSIYQTKEAPFVWVIRNGILQLRPIKTGDFGNNIIQILEGLNPGEIIVTAGVHKLKEGQQVKILGGGRS